MEALSKHVDFLELNGRLHMRDLSRCVDHLDNEVRMLWKMQACLFFSPNSRLYLSQARGLLCGIQWRDHAPRSCVQRIRFLVALDSYWISLGVGSTCSK
jgi:hypothetical protein